MSQNSLSDATAPDELRAKLQQLHRALLHLHKALLDNERAAYEAEHGKITSGQMLQLAIYDERFAWLRAISELIVRIDEMLEAKDPPASTISAELLLETVRNLLLPNDQSNDFAKKYQSGLKQTASAAAAHQEAVEVLQSAM